MEIYEYEVTTARHYLYIIQFIPCNLVFNMFLRVRIIFNGIRVLVQMEEREGRCNKKISTSKISFTNSI